MDFGTVWEQGKPRSGIDLLCGKRVVWIMNRNWLLCSTTNNLCSVYNFKRNPSITTMVQQWTQKQGIDSTNLHRETRVKVILVARPLLTPVAQSLCRGEHSRTSLYSLSNIISIEIFCCCSWSIINAYPDKEVRNKTTLHGLVTTCRDRGSFWEGDGHC
jgi:hypothetical protein